MKHKHDKISAQYQQAFKKSVESCNFYKFFKIQGPQFWQNLMEQKETLTWSVTHHGCLTYKISAQYLQAFEKKSAENCNSYEFFKVQGP